MLGLAALTALLAYLSVERVFVSIALFPAHESAIPWNLKTFTNEHGGSSVSVTEDIYGLEYEYRLADVKDAYLIVALAFDKSGNAKIPVDLSRYSTATFRVKCAPHDILNFYVHSVDEKVTSPENFYSYRIASALFSCSEAWSEVEIDLSHLNVPVWWLDLANVDVSDQTYRLDKVVAIAFNASRQGQVNTPVSVKISELILHGRDRRYAWAFGALLAVVWAGFIGWFFSQYTANLVADVKDKLKKDRTLIAYQQLSIEPYKDEEKSLILRFVATGYANPDMSLEFAVAVLGINRTRINEILKEELDLTFSAYLNKLRLAEAARLFARQQNANVAEIAYSVGYNNVSYFNRLFKNEYGCSPGKFVALNTPKKGGQ